MKPKKTNIDPIKNLELSEGFWPILALDHGLTVGHEESVPISLIPELFEGSDKTIGSIVMTYGLAKITASFHSLPIIIQCIGAPNNHLKFEVCTVEQALAIGAKGIAVQVDFSLSRKKMSLLLKDVIRLTHNAHLSNLPVLFMVMQEIHSVTSLLQAARFCLELGADLIKVRCNILKFDTQEREVLKSQLKAYPPILLGGGKVNSNILLELNQGRQLGFSGYCIGRNIFQSKNPKEMFHHLIHAWFNQNNPH